MRSTVIVFVGLLSLALPAAATTSIEVLYREPANTFEVLDNVSQWWPGYSEMLYRGAWVDSFGVSSADSTFFVRYAKIRNRYYDKTGQENEDPRENESGLFTDSAVLSADPVAYAFYSSETMEEAYVKLAKFVEPSDVDYLRSFYANFADRVSRIAHGTQQSTAASLERTRQTLSTSEIRSYLDGIIDFFGVTGDIKFTALYVWWPDQDRIAASPNGHYLLLRVRPYSGESVSNADVVVHEMVHVISAMQPTVQKRAVSDVVLAACPDAVELTRRLGVLEEPLATILGNMEFRRRFEPKRFAWGRSWYGELWVDLMARLLYPAVMDAIRGKETVNGPFSADAAALCTIAVRALEAGRSASN